MTSEQSSVKTEAKVESRKSDVPQPSTFDPSAVSGQALRPSTELGFISPVVAKIAAEHGVNLQNVAGTGVEWENYEE
ncbi:MAG: E3 binding domain-containing protein [Anaerolineales bacterium]